MPNETLGGMPDEDMMSQSGEADSMAAQHDEGDDDAISVFLPKAALPQGKKYAKGDKIELEVEDVDPETGDVQACIYGEEGNQKDAGMGMSSSDAFDKAMPEEKGY